MTKHDREPRSFRVHWQAVALAAVALAGAPVLTGSSLSGAAAAAETTTVTAAAAGDPVYARLYNQSTGKCLAVGGGAASEKGDNPIEWNCTTSESQYWALEPVTGGYQVRNLASGMCLAMANSTKVHGANPIQWPCDGGDGGEQAWAQDANERLKNVNSGFCLAFLDGETANYTKAAQWTCGDSKDQQWLW